MPGNLFFTFDIDGDRELSARFHGLLAALEDWSPAFEAIVTDWRATMREKFASGGTFESGSDAQGNALPGWAPLSEQYAKWKARKYPGAGILVRTGQLREASINPDVTIEPRQLKLVIPTPWAIYHQSSRPRKRLPRRAFASLTAKQPGRWVRALREHLVKAAKARAGTA